MKRKAFKALLGIIISLTLIAIFLPTAFAGPDDTALTKTTNPTLYAVLHTTPFNLDPDNNEIITQGEMAGLPSYLDLYNKGITDLSGMEYATSVTQLNLGNDTSTSIGNNTFTNIEALKNLSSLYYLTLDGNTTLTAFPADVSHMTSLWGLQVFYIPNITSLPNFQSAIQNLHALSNLSISGAYSLSFLSGATHLYTLYWRDTPTLSSTNLASLSTSHVTSLDLTNDSLDDSDLAGLTGMNLGGLFLNNNNLTSLSAISGMTNLYTLTFNSNHVTSLSGLSGLTNLSRLEFNNNYVADLSPVASLPINELKCTNNYLDPTAGSADRTIIDAYSGTKMYATQRQITVTYNGDGKGTPSRATDSVYYEQSYTAPTLTETSDKLFTGWDTNNDGNKDVKGGDPMSVTLSRPIPGDTVEFKAVYDDATIAVDSTSNNPLYVALTTACPGLDPNHNGTIMDYELERLTGTLDLHNSSITSISGLQYCTHITTLNLGNSYPYVNINQISDISYLAGLTNLQYLNLSDNQITNVTSLAGLTHLLNLYLDSNPDLADISSLTGLSNLQILELAHDTNINLPSSLSGMTALSNLDLSYIPLLSGKANFHAAVTSLPNLYSLGITYSGVKDVSFLSPTAAPHLRSLGWGGTFLSPSEVETVSGLSQITTLLMVNDHIGDAGLSKLSGLTGLTYLMLWDNYLTDLTPIAGLTNLKTLYMGHNYVSDLSPLSGIHLDTLDCQQNYLDATPGSADMTTLAALNVPHLTSNDQIQFTIYYMSDPAKGTPQRATDTLYYGQSFKTPRVTTFGYDFLGWDTNADLTADVAPATVTTFAPVKPCSADYYYNAVYSSAPQSPSVYLTTIDLSNGASFSPAFSPTNTSPKIYLNEDTSTVTLTPIKAYDGATMTIAGQTTTSYATPTINNGKSATVKVKVSIPGKSKTYSIKITRNKSTNNLLDSIGTNTSEKVTGFDPLVQDSYLVLGEFTKKVTLTANVHTGLAKATYTKTISLDNGGSKIVKITVKAQSGVKNYYNVHISRAKSTNANLKSLKVTGYTLTPPFSAGGTSYSITMPANKTTVTVSAAKLESHAAMTINGLNKTSLKVTVPSGSGPVATVTIVVTAQDPSIPPKTYIITINRP